VEPRNTWHLGCTCCPQTRAAATYRLTDWLGPTGGGTPAPAAAKPPTPEELAEMVRAAVRQELEARKGTA
jgi:hypothetical protein